MLDAAIASLGVPTDQVRLVWIRNTLDIAEFAVSEAFLDEVSDSAELEKLTDLQPLAKLMSAAFDAKAQRRRDAKKKKERE